MKKYYIGIKTVCLLLMFISAKLVHAAQLASPHYQVIDRMGVNAHSGQVVFNVPTLSIGGDLGLSHEVSSSNSNFIQQNSGGAYIGLFDKFFGAAVYTQVASQGTSFVYADEYSTYNPNDHFRDYSSGIWMMRVHDHLGSADFKVMSGGYARGLFSSDSTNYFYEALRDKRHKLVIPSGQPGYLLWTKPDGTQTWFYRGISNINARTKGYISKIIYPNGFTLYFDRTAGNSVAINSVRTNTGYQLKYNFVVDTTLSYGVGSGNTYYENPPENNTTWSQQNAWSIIGINNVHERCDSNQNTVCISEEDQCPAFEAAGQSCTILNNKWPTAKFSWPTGMPRAVFFGENTYSVKDALGRTTEIKLKAYDKYTNENGAPISSGHPIGQAFVPRVMSIKPAGSDVPTVAYTYKNYLKYNYADIRWAEGQTNDSVMPGAYIYTVPGETALVWTANGVSGSHTNYIEGIRQSIYPYAVGYPAADGLFVKKLHQFFGALMYVQSQSGILTFQFDYRNLPHIKASADGPGEIYSYDSRGNLEKITYAAHDGSSQQVVEAEYPTNQECTNPKTCNQAEWVSDAKGNKTYYTYHPESGQVATVTSPPNQHGISPQTRYEYEQFYATYKNESGVMTTAQDPIWLKVSEKYCIDSAYATGGCSGNDEVIITHQYNSDNLHLTSVSITEPYSQVVQITCYEYDIYGNRIGETRPKGACN